MISHRCRAFRIGIEFRFLRDFDRFLGHALWWRWRRRHLFKHRAWPFGLRFLLDRQPTFFLFLAAHRPVTLSAFLGRLFCALLALAGLDTALPARQLDHPLPLLVREHRTRGQPQGRLPLLKVTNPGVAIPLDPVVNDVCPDTLGRLGKVDKHHLPAAVVNGLGKLFDEHLEPVNAHARAQNQEHVRAQREVVLDEGTDEVRVGVVLAVEHDVGPQLANAERSFASFFPSSGCACTVRTGGLSASQGICKPGLLVP
jgi:hypothetical protein